MHTPGQACAVLLPDDSLSCSGLENDALIMERQMAELFPLDVRIKLAAKLTVRAKIFYDIWWLSYEPVSGARILPTMNRYPDFFVLDQHAHWIALIVQVTGLFEKTRRDTVNFNAIIKSARPFIANSALESALNLLKATELTSPKVKVLRDNLFAHRSASLSYDDTFRQAELTSNQLCELIGRGLQIANILLGARGLPFECFDDAPRKSVHALLDDLANL
jgi:hypothetical protein